MGMTHGRQRNIKATSMGALFFEGKERASCAETFVMNKGMSSPIHFDVDRGKGSHPVYGHAAGVMMPLDRTTTGDIKKATIVCAADKQRVIDGLGMTVDNSVQKQYDGEISSMEELVATLREIGVRFVEVRFPAYCSYFLPRGCAHAFETLALTESVVWAPVMIDS